MPKQEPPFVNISQGTIAILEKRGLNLTQVAEALEVSKSFVSRVKAGTRSFTLQHLAKVSRKIDEDLPLLLFQTMFDPNQIKPEYKKMYQMGKRLLEKTPPKRKKRSKAA